LWRFWQKVIGQTPHSSVRLCTAGVLVADESERLAKDIPDRTETPSGLKRDQPPLAEFDGQRRLEYARQ